MIRGVRSVALGVTDIPAASAFFEKIWTLERVSSEVASVYLRGTGPYQHILSLHPAPAARILRVAFDVDTKTAVDRLNATLRDAGVADVETLGPVNGPGGGYGFGCLDTEGRGLAFVTGVADHADKGPCPIASASSPMSISTRRRPTPASTSSRSCSASA